MNVLAFLTRTRGRRLDWTDALTYVYLVVGLFTMFAPVVWLVMSSFKTEAALGQFPPTFLPYAQKTVAVPGHDKPLPLFRVADPAGGPGATRELAQVSRIGIMATMIDPANPQQTVQVNIRERQPVQEIRFATANYTDLFEKFTFGRYLWNSTFITVVATALTLLVNSMAAFALSKYRFPGRNAVFLLIIATLMIPPTISLVPVFLVINSVGLLNSLWGVILPAIATPTGVFLLRQYMLTIPDELLEAARMDHASEWRIYWRIILPLSAPALAVLAIFSVMWRWNDFIWPFIVLSSESNSTLQLALARLNGAAGIEWSTLLAATVITMLPILMVFLLLQRYFLSGTVAGSVKG